MKKNYVVVLVVVIVVAFVVGILFSQRNSDDAPTTTNSGTNTNESSDQSNSDAFIVSYDGANFAPNPITVSVGDTVIFRNDSETPVWPASDVHPTHNELPGFDALKGLSQGEEYSFTFEEAGEWTYHNHLNAGHAGLVIVTE